MALRIGSVGSDAVQGATYGAVAGGCEKCEVPRYELRIAVVEILLVKRDGAREAGGCEDLEELRIDPRSLGREGNVDRPVVAVHPLEVLDVDDVDVVANEREVRVPGRAALDG